MKLARFNGNLEILTFWISFLPGFYLSYIALQEPWVLFRLARVALSIPVNTIETYTSAAAAYRFEHLGEALLDTALLTTSSWPIDWLALVPLGTLFTAFMYYALVLKISNSRFLALVMVLYAGWYYPRLVSQYGMQTYAWTNGLFIGFLWLYWEWLEHRRAIFSLLMMWVFVTTFLFYQTTPLWIILLMVAGNSLLTIRSRSMQEGPAVSWSLPLFCVVLYFSFDSVFYENFLPNVVSEAAETSLLENVASKVVGPLLAQQSVQLPAYHQMVANPRFAVLSTLLSFLIFVIPVAAWCAIKLTRAWRKRSLCSLAGTREDIFCWSLVFVTLGHALGYSSYGAVSLRLVPLVFPFLMLIIPSSLRLPHSKIITKVLSLALLVVAMSGFVCYGRALRSDPVASQMGMVPKILPDTSSLMADANVYGVINLIAGKQQKRFDFVWADDQKYAALVTGKPMENNVYAVLDKYNRPFITTSWAFLEPWVKYLPQIEQNSLLSKVYDSQYLSVFQSASKPLPLDQGSYVEVKHEKNFWMEVLASLFLAVVLVLVLPGMAVLLLLRDLGFLKFEDSYSMLFFSMVLSLGFVTAVGYLVNFTRIGLKNYALVNALIVLILFVVYIIIRWSHRKPFKFPPVGFRSLFVVILVWCLGSALITVSRSASKAELTEFFITQTASSKFSPVIYVRNQMRSEQEYILSWRQGDQSTRLLATFRLSPGEVFRQRLGSFVPVAGGLNLELWNRDESLSLFLR